MASNRVEADVRVSGVGGSICLVTPVSDFAKEWVDENVHIEGWQWLGPSFGVDPRFLDGLLSDMICAGLEVD